MSDKTPSPPPAVDKVPESGDGFDSVTAVDSIGAPVKAATLALSAIPVEVKQGEEQPSSAASPLHMLPTVSYHCGIPP